jgi:hypothetical protein
MDINLLIMKGESSSSKQTIHLMDFNGVAEKNPYAPVFMPRPRAKTLHIPIKILTTAQHRTWSR